MASKTRLATAGAVAVLALLSSASAAQATNYYIGASSVSPGALRYLEDAETDAPYGERRVKWNSGNTRLTGNSYNDVDDTSVYEYTEIPADVHTSRHYSTAHPIYFNYYGVAVRLYVRNKSSSVTMSLYGQAQI